MPTGKSSNRFEYGKKKNVTVFTSMSKDSDGNGTFALLLQQGVGTGLRVALRREQYIVVDEFLKGLE